MVHPKLVLCWAIAFRAILSGGKFFGEVGAFTQEDFRNQQLRVETTLILASAIQDDVVAAMKIVQYHMLLDNPNMLEEKLSLQRIEDSFLERASSTTWIASSMTQNWCKVSGNKLLLYFLRLASDKLSVYDMIPDIQALKKYLDDNDLQINMPKTYAICTNSDGILLDEVKENPFFYKTGEIPTVLDNLNKLDSIYVMNLLKKIKSGELITSPKIIAGLLKILTFQHANPVQMESINMVIQKLLNGEIATEGATWDENPYRLIENALENSIGESNLKNIEISIGRVIDLLNASKQTWSPNTFCRQAIDSNLDLNVTFLLERFIKENLPSNVRNSLVILKMASDLRILDMENEKKYYLAKVNTKEFKCNPCLTLLTSLLERINRYNITKEISFNAKLILNYLRNYNAMKKVCESEDSILGHQKQQIKKEDKFSNGTKNLSNLNSRIQVDQTATLNSWHPNSYANFVPPTPFQNPSTTQNGSYYNSNYKLRNRQTNGSSKISQEPGSTQSSYAHIKLSNSMYNNKAIKYGIQNSNKKTSPNGGLNTNVFSQKNFKINTSKNPRSYYSLASHHNGGQHNVHKNYRKSTNFPALPNSLNSRKQLHEKSYLIRIPSYRAFLKKEYNTFPYRRASSRTLLDSQRPGLHGGKNKVYVDHDVSKPYGQFYYPNFLPSGASRDFSSNTEKKLYYTPSQLIRHYNNFYDNRNKQGRPENSGVIPINNSPMKQIYYLKFIPIPHTCMPNFNQGSAITKFHSRPASMEDIHSPDYDEMKSKDISKGLHMTTHFPAKMLPPINVGDSLMKKTIPENNGSHKQRLSNYACIDSESGVHYQNMGNLEIKPISLNKLNITELLNIVDHTIIDRNALKMLNEYMQSSLVYKAITNIYGPEVNRTTMLKNSLILIKSMTLPPDIINKIDKTLLNLLIFGEEYNAPKLQKNGTNTSNMQERNVEHCESSKDKWNEVVEDILHLCNRHGDRESYESLNILKGQLNSSSVKDLVMYLDNPPKNRISLLKTILTFIRNTPLPSEISSMIDKILENITHSEELQYPQTKAILSDEWKETKDIHKLNLQNLLKDINIGEIDNAELKEVEKYWETLHLQELTSTLNRPDLSRAILLKIMLDFVKMMPIPAHISSTIDEILKNIEYDGNGVVPPMAHLEVAEDNLTMNVTLDIRHLLGAVNQSAVDKETLTNLEQYLKESPLQKLVTDFYRPNITTSTLLQNILNFLKSMSIPARVSFVIDKLLDKIVTKVDRNASQMISNENTSEQKWEEDQHSLKIDIESLLNEIDKSSLLSKETQVIKDYLYLDDVQEYASSINSSNISQSSLLKKILLFAKEISLPGEIQTALEHIIEKIKLYTSDMDPTSEPDGEIEDNDEQNYKDKDSLKKYLPNLFIQVNKSAVATETIDTVKDYIADSPVYEEILNILAPNASRATLLKNILMLAKRIIHPPEISSMIDDTLDNIIFEGPGALPPVILEDDPKKNLTESEDTTSEDDITEAMIKNETLEHKYLNFRGKIDLQSLLTAVNTSSIDPDTINLVIDYIKKSPLYDLVSEIYKNNLSDAMFLQKMLLLFKMIPLSREISIMIDNVNKNIIFHGSNIPSKDLVSDISPLIEEVFEDIPQHVNSEDQEKMNDNQTETPFNTTTSSSTFDFKLMKRNDISNLLRYVNVSAVDNNALNNIKDILLKSPAYEFVMLMQAPNVSRASFLKYILLFTKLNQSSHKISSQIDNLLANIIYNGTGALPLPTILSNDSNKKIDVVSLFDVLDKNVITHKTLCTVKNYIINSPIKELVSDIYKVKSNRPKFLRTLLRFAKTISFSVADKAIIDRIDKNIIGI